MADSSDGSLDKLFCRNIEGSTQGYQWVTQKHATDVCRGKPGTTAKCGDGQGGEVTYYCDGNTWVDESTWQRVVEEKGKEEERKQEELAREAQRVQEEAHGEAGQGAGQETGLSCSLEAYPQRIKVGQEITWIIKTDNFIGSGAAWHGTDNGVELGGPVPVHEFPKPNSPQLWMENYKYKKGGVYTRYAVIKDTEGRTCNTNTLGVVIEDGGLAQGLPGGEALTSVSQYVNQIGSKTISKITLLLPPYGQQRAVNPGEPMSFSLPDTGGVSQTVAVPIIITYSDGSTSNKTISFRHKGNTCALSGGKCANANGQTRDGDTCNAYRSDLTGCGRDNVYPYCYTGCLKQPSGTIAPTPRPTVPPTPTPTSTQSCTSLGYTCADSTGVTADKIKKCDLGTYRSDYAGCPQYYYCYTSCSVNSTPTPTPAESSSTCPGGIGACGDSNYGGLSLSCDRNQQYYLGNPAHDKWCSQQNGVDSGYYCYACR